MRIRANRTPGALFITTLSASPTVRTTRATCDVGYSTVRERVIVHGELLLIYFSSPSRRRAAEERSRGPRFHAEVDIGAPISTVYKSSQARSRGGPVLDASSLGPTHTQLSTSGFAMLSFAAVLGLLSATLTLGPQGVAAGQSMRVATYNLRYDSMPNNITVNETLNALPDPLTAPTYFGDKGEQPWSTRRVKVYQHLNSEGIVLAGFQEALIRQVNDLATLFGPGWGWVGVGRDDGVAAGEFSPIFYKKSAIKLVSNDSFWLSDTPFEPSQYPGADTRRICTASHLILKTNPGRPIRFTYLNAHLDDSSDAERRLAASLMLARARYEAYKTRGPVIVTGDFNSQATGSDSGAYQIITGQIPPVAINATFAAKYAVPNATLPDFKMLDLRGETPRKHVSGDFATWTDFVAPGDSSQYQRIDFVFGDSTKKWTADAYKVGPSRTDDGIQASDHRPVFADITLL